MHGFMEWESINYNTHHLTVYPKVNRYDVPDDGYEYRICRGKHCLYGAYKHRKKDMYTGKLKNGANIYICAGCKKSYAGKIKLKRCE